MLTKHSSLFEPILINNLQIPNKLAVAPMTRVSAKKDGRVGPLMKDYYKKFAVGGFGLIITEGLYTDEDYSQGYFEQPGIANAEQAKSWEPIVKAVKDEGSVIIAQLMHAGSLSQYNHSNDMTLGPSSILPKGEQLSFYHGEGLYSVPKEMTKRDINNVIQGFSRSAALAQASGFNGIEIHGANGYLLDQFFTEYTNKRKDSYGGSTTNRLKIYQEIIEAIRLAVGAEFIIGVRFSQKKVNDNDYVWPNGEETAKQAFALMKECGVDYIHTTEPVLNDAAFEGSGTLAQLAKKYSSLPVIANGGVNSAELASSVLRHEQADIIAIGKGALANQNWPQLVKNKASLQAFDFSMLSPIANLGCASRYLDRQKNILPQ